MNITKKDLHKIEMYLVSLCEDNTTLREEIINNFTSLIYKVEE